MADIELVIKLDEDIAQGIIDGENDTPRNIVRAFQATIADAIKNGILIPKGHGRLIDMKNLQNFVSRYTEYDAIQLILADREDYIPTIIEADKESKDADSN